MSFFAMDTCRRHVASSWKIESIVMSIGEFGRAYSLSSSDAYAYLKKYKGIAYLDDYHEPLSCLPMESLVDDLAQVCRNNGGMLK